jgi:hypothetical protein
MRDIVLNVVTPLAVIYALASVVVLVRRPYDLTQAEGLRRWCKVNWVAIGLLVLAVVVKFVLFVIGAMTNPLDCFTC